MAQLQKAKKKEFLEALKTSLGVKSRAMAKAGIKKYDTIRKWEAEDPEFLKAELEIMEYAGDFVENALYKKIQDGDTTAIIFYCKTKLKHRGYVERSEITGDKGKDLLENIKVVVCGAGTNTDNKNI